MKATKAQVEARVAEILSIRLAGAQFWDIREYVREKEGEDGSPWQLAEGQKPLSDPQLWRYIAKADKAISSSVLSSQKKALRRHRARRDYLYGLAVNQGDIRAALACIRDDAELQGLYPPKGLRITGGGAVVQLNITEEVVTANDNANSKPNDPPPPGTASVP